MYQGQKISGGKAGVKCPTCGKKLDPRRHGDLVCDGEVFCSQCRLYDRRLLEGRTFEEISHWHERLCQAFNYEAFSLAMGEPSPPPGPFDFLEEKKVLMAEADHRERVIILYPAGLRLATLCHELAHLMTDQGHTAAWAKTFAALVAWVKVQLPPDQITVGTYTCLLKPRTE